MEEDLKISKVEYLRNHLLDQTLILNWGSDDQTVFYKSLAERWPPVEEDLRCKDELKAFRMWLMSS